MTKEAREFIGNELPNICASLGIEIVIFAVMADHIHLQFRCGPVDLSKLVGRLKACLSLELGRANLKSSRSFWSRGYFLTTIGHSSRSVTTYIENQNND